MRLPKSERYSKIYRAMWSDERFMALSAPTANAQSLWLYILSGHHVSAVPGLWRFSLGQTAETLRWPYDDTLRCFNELTDAGMTSYDRRAGTLWLPNAYRYNKPNATSVVDGWREPLAEIPECPLKREAIVVLGDWLAEIGPKFLEAFRRATGDMPRMASPNPSGLPRRSAGTGSATASTTASALNAPPVTPRGAVGTTGSGQNPARKTTTSGTGSGTTSGPKQALPVTTASASPKLTNSAKIAEYEGVNTTGSTTGSAGLIVESQAQKEKEEEPPYPPTARATPDGPRVVSVNARIQTPSGDPAKTNPSKASGSPSRAPRGEGGGNGASGVSDGPTGPAKADGGDLEESGLLPIDSASSRASFAVQTVHRLTNGKIGNVLSDTDMRTLEARIRTLQSRDGSRLPRDIFIAFSKWLVEGGNEGSGGLAWSHITPTWQWLIKDRRLETHLSEAQAWIATKQLGDRPVTVIKEDTPEEEQAMSREKKAAIIASCCSPAFVSMRNKGKKPDDRVQLLGPSEALERMRAIFPPDEAKQRVDTIFGDLKRRGAVA